MRLLPRQRRAAHAPIHARGLSPLADWRASQETPRRGGQGVGVQATGSGSSPRGRAGSLQPVIHVRPGHSSESLPIPWLRTTQPPTAPGCRLSMGVAPGQAVTQDGTCLRLPDPQVRLQKVDGQDQGGRGEVGANQEVTELIVCHQCVRGLVTPRVPRRSLASPDSALAPVAARRRAGALGRAGGAASGARDRRHVPRAGACASSACRRLQPGCSATNSLLRALAE